MTTFTSAAAAVAASLAMVMSTGALGACKTTLRGELVQAPGGGKAFPLQFLFFSLSETTQETKKDSGTSREALEELSILHRAEYEHHASHSIRVGHRPAKRLSERTRDVRGH